MATVAFLIDADPTRLDLGPVAAEALARLGVTHLAVYRNGAIVCLVLEGWTFDPASAPDAARAVGFASSARVLRPVMQSALRAGTQEDSDR